MPNWEVTKRKSNKAPMMRFKTYVGLTTSVCHLRTMGRDSALTSVCQLRTMGRDSGCTAFLTAILTAIIAFH
jgi:hypothetical protein